MEFKNEDVKLRFTVPERPTVRQQLRYMGAAVSLGGEDLFLAFWRGALTMIEDWECELVTDPRKLDLDTVQDLRITELVTWVGLRVREYVTSLDELPKA